MCLVRLALRRLACLRCFELPHRQLLQRATGLFVNFLLPLSPSRVHPESVAATRVAMPLRLLVCKGMAPRLWHVPPVFVCASPLRLILRVIELSPRSLALLFRACLCNVIALLSPRRAAKITLKQALRQSPRTLSLLLVCLPLTSKATSIRRPIRIRSPLELPLCPD